MGYVIHTFAHIQEYKSDNYKNPKIEAILSIFLFLSYFGWGLMLFNDPSEFLLGQYNLGFILGVTLTLIGVFLFAMAVYKFKGFEGPNFLVTGGIYSKIRNPMYIGIIMIHLGAPLLLNRFLTFASNVIWIPLILLWIYLEQKNLEKIFGQKYTAYKKKTII